MLSFNPSVCLRSLLLGFALANPAFVAAEELTDESWDPRLNGIWKVTSVVLDGEPVKDDTDCKYAICDGVIVSASPDTVSFMPRTTLVPFGKPGQLPSGVPNEEDSTPKPADADPVRAEAKDPLEDIIVRLEVNRATVKKMMPYPWIDLRTAFEKEDDNWPGIYHIEGDKLTLAFATTRPTKLESPKINMDGLFTRPSPTSRMITLVRKPQK